MGLPGIGFVRDRSNTTATWHTNLDTFERIIEQDAKQSAITIASVLYHLAMRDEMLPRFPATEMPPLRRAGELTSRLGFGVRGFEGSRVPSREPDLSPILCSFDSVLM